MFERPLTKEEYRNFGIYLRQTAHQAPNSPIFEKQLICGKERYTLFLMFGKDRVYTLYALRAFQQSDGSVGYQAMKNANVLAGLTHILILQSIPGGANGAARGDTGRSPGGDAYPGYAADAVNCSYSAHPAYSAPTPNSANLEISGIVPF